MNKLKAECTLLNNMYLINLLHANVLKMEHRYFKFYKDLNFMRKNRNCVFRYSVKIIS